MGNFNQCSLNFSISGQPKPQVLFQVRNARQLVEAVLIFQSEASSILSSIVASNTGKPSSLYDRASALIHNGFHSGGIKDIAARFREGANSVIAINPVQKQVIYPRAETSDPPYDVLELRLRDAINI